MPRKKSHKTVLILGAGSDMAVSFVTLLANTWHKCTFHLLARNPAHLQNLKAHAEGHGHQVFLHEYDLLNPPVADFTGIEYCVVYAGWLPPDNNDPEKTMTINSTAIQKFLDKLITVNKLSLEHIIITGSIAGVRVRPSNKAYGQAKASLHSYVYDLQKKYGAAVTFTLVIPGYVKTKMIAGHRTPGLLTVSPVKMAKKYLEWLVTKPTVIYSQPIWRLIAGILRKVPEFIIQRMKF